MRRWAILLVLLAIAVPALARKEESLDELLKRAESAKLQDQPKLYIEAARRQLKAADELYTAGNVDQAHAAVEELVNYSDKAANAATQSGKKLKNTEISVRKMAERLRDIKRTLNFDDQAPVQKAIDHLEKLRTELLTRMFGPKD